MSASSLSGYCFPDMSSLKDQESERARGRINAQMLGKLVQIAAVMFGFGYALVPLYKKICEVTGVNVLTQKDDASPIANTQIDKSRTITVELDANAQGPWRFRPTISSLQVHPDSASAFSMSVMT